jgi:hypothetical protein
MAEFYVKGPFVVPWVQRGKARIIDTDNLKDFWDTHVGTELQWARGCYVFGMRAGKGIVPVYVGRATKSFKQECFTHHKLYKINTSLLDWERGAPVLFLVPQDAKGGRTNTRLVAIAEKFLIQNAIARNPELANIHGTKLEKWGIRGVLRGGKGVPSAAAKDFKRMMGF